ncbi:MAG: MaoC/PaaZ C-terminal domain-containing protein [Flavobacteriaceae bacterium]
MTKYLEDFTVGDKQKSPGRTVTDTDLAMFTWLSGDNNPAHTDEEFCRKNSPFKTRILQGAYGFSIATGLSAQIGEMAGSAIASLGVENWVYKGPIFVGDTLWLETEVVEARPTSKPGRGVVKRRFQLINQKGEVVQEGLSSVLVYARG